jgi:signal transduction histidine kinase
MASELSAASALAPRVDADADRGLVGGIIHEVRNPVFAMTATLDALEQRLGDRSDVRPHVTVLRQELERLTTLMRDLGEVIAPRGSRRRTSLSGLLARVVAERERSAAELGVTLVARFSSSLGFAELDETRMAAALARLLDFSVARTPSGGAVRLSAHRSEHTARIALCDGGPVLAPDVLRVALAPFGLRRSGQLSLDVAIAAAVVRAHGGGMSVANEPVEGVRFTLELPCTEVDTSPARS